MRDSIEIPTASLKNTTTENSKQESGSDFKCGRQRIAIWPSKPEIVIYLWKCDTASNFQRQIRDFRPCRIHWSMSQVITTMTDNRKWQVRLSLAIYWYFWLSVSVAVARRYFLRASRNRKRQICRCNFDDVCHSFRGINISGFAGHVAISVSLSLSQSLGDTFVELAVVKNSVDIRRHLS